MEREDYGRDYLLRVRVPEEAAPGFPEEWRTSTLGLLVDAGAATPVIFTRDVAERFKEFLDTLPVGSFGVSPVVTVEEREFPGQYAQGV